MNLSLILSGIICVTLNSGFTGDGAGKQGNIIEPLRPYVEQVVTILSEIPDERREILGLIASDISEHLKSKQEAQLTYICTHKSRRSHMAQLWTQTAAYYYGLDQVTSFSGGTEATECNIRTVAALRRVGFSVVSTTEGENPVYLIQFSDERPPMRAYSKIYNALSLIEQVPVMPFIMWIPKSVMTPMKKLQPMMPDALK